MTSRLFRVVEQVRLALGAAGSLCPSELETMLDPEVRPLLDRALAFLHGRDEILVDVRGGAVHLRSRVNALVLEALGRDERCSTIEGLSGTLGLPPAVCCDVLGWLEREGRVVFEDQDRIRLR